MGDSGKLQPPPPPKQDMNLLEDRRGEEKGLDSGERGEEPLGAGVFTVDETKYSIHKVCFIYL